MNLTIREAQSSELPIILAMVKEAFGADEGAEVATLISDLIADPTASPLLSLVAMVDEKIVGHILFTKVQIEGSKASSVPASILCPLAVSPNYQKRGIGGQLIRTGLEQLKNQGVQLVFVLGYPAYYTRYGFSPAGVHGLNAPYEIAPENTDAWMLQELQPGIAEAISGVITCADCLHDPKYWQE